MSALRSFYFLATICTLFFGCKSESTDKASANTELIKEDSSQINTQIDTASFDHVNDVFVERLQQDSAENRKVATDDQRSSIPKVSVISKKNKLTKKPIIQFENEFIDFGDIEEGDIIKEKFVFTNKGNAPLEILSAKGSCGCTQPSFPFIAVPPGESGYIGVEYNSISKWGKQNVNIRIKTNARAADYILYMKGFVNEKSKEIHSEKDSLVKNLD